MKGLRKMKKPLHTVAQLPVFVVLRTIANYERVRIKPTHATAANSTRNCNVSYNAGCQ